ncbi:DeoR/GlpR family DNA-binding transcription regulator [Arenicellales bacterium nBUS_45]
MLKLISFEDLKNMALVSKYEAAIMDTLNLCGQVTINDLAVQLGVSGETVRRHVDPLVKRGLALRVHGGIIAPISTQEAPFHRRLRKNLDAKRRLAKAASELVKDGDSLIIDCGSTTAYVAQALCDHSNLNVVTNSIEIARTLASRNGNRTYVTGGELRADDAAAFGKGAIDFIQQFNVDYAILSVGAINRDNEFLDFHLCEAEFSRAAIGQARKSCFVTDSSKFNSDALVKVCGLDDVDIVVTEAQPPAPFREACELSETRLFFPVEDLT